MFISILNIIQTYMYAYVWLNSHKSTDSHSHAFNAHNIMNWMCYVYDQATRTDTNIDLIVKKLNKLIMSFEESQFAMYNHSIWHGVEGGDGKCNFPIFQCKYYMH